MLFVYLSHMTLFTACLSLHGRRVYASRHCLSCRPVRPRHELQQQGRSALYRFCCGGHTPHAARDDESLCERLPRWLLPKMVVNRWVRYVVPVFFCALTAVSVYGAVHIQPGLQLKNLVLESSYYHRYLTVKEKYFVDHIPIGFNIIGEVNYSDVKVQEQVKELLKTAKRDKDINPKFEHCWLTAFLDSSFNNDGDKAKAVYFFLGKNPVFKKDVVLREARGRDGNLTGYISASRCSVLSVGLTDQYDQAYLMVKMRAVAEQSPLPVVAFHHNFELFEQYLATLPATVETLGYAVAVIVVVCIIFLPHPFIVALITLSIILIFVNILGFMYFWGITLSSVTMIHLIMSVGFSVDFSAHVCSAYLMSNFITRSERAYDAITHAASPILNGAMSSMMGVFLLAFSGAYLFSTFLSLIHI